MTTLTRNYSMSDADLCLFTSNLVVTMTRDQAQFTIRGVTAAMVTALKALGDAFEVFPPDNYYLQEYVLATETKNTTRESCTLKLRAIMGYAKIKYGSHSTQVKKFGAGDMTKQADKTFLVTCRMGIKVANDYLTDLTPVGLTAAMITDLTTAATLLETNLNTIATAQANRDIKTQERITKGNEIYTLVARYCEIGKIIWEDVDPAKYNDYVIYDSPIIPLSIPQNLVASKIIGPTPSIHLTWDAVNHGTNYDIFTSIVPIGAPSAVFEVVGNVAELEYNGSAIAGMRNYYKVTAKNSTQTSEMSDEVWIDG